MCWQSGVEDGECGIPEGSERSSHIGVNSWDPLSLVRIHCLQPDVAIKKEEEELS